MDEFKARLKKSWRGALVCAVLCAGLGWLLLSPVVTLGFTQLGSKLNHLSYDLPFGFRGARPPKEVVIVAMDELSHTELNQRYDGPWDRSLHARLLRRMTKEGAAGVVFDVVFSGPGPDTNIDNDFANAIKENGKVVLAADYTKQTGSDLAVGNAMYLPYDPFYAAAEGRCGLTAFYPDDDLFPRYYIPADPKDDRVPSEAWAAAEVFHAPITKIASKKITPFNLNYYGPSGAIPFVSFFKVVADDSDLPTNFFTGKIVFVGAHIKTHYSGERRDEYPTPFSLWDNNSFTCGVEVQATAFLNLLHDDCLYQVSAPIEFAIILVSGLLIGFGLRLLVPLQATLAALALIIAAFASDYFLFMTYHRWYCWCIIAAFQVPLAWMWSVVFNSVQLYVERRLFEQTLGLYLSHKLVKKFANDPKLRQPGAQKQLLTILFTDIAGFTSISEGMDPDDLARLMNQYFQGAVQNCIFPMEGTVVKYIGDAIFAFWNAPEPQSDHAYRACEAALRLTEQDKFSANGHPLITRLGLHTGEANVGNFGSDARFDYTALGENINLASRMEGLNKYLGTRVLLTSETKDDIDGRLVTRYLGLFRLKGFEKAVGVHELMTRSDQEGQVRDLRALFAEALEKFAQRDFAAAESAFRRVLEIDSEDGPAKFYLEQIEELRGAELPPDWKGDITLKDK
jgi:adenylate cyclase